MVKIAPSILAADFANLGRDVEKLEAWGASYVHCDVMDGIFVPNMSLGPGLIKAIRPYTSLPLDVHLMITQPERYIENFALAGADSITVHQEATPHLHRALSLIKESGVKTGVALNPSTSISSIENVLDMVDMVLIMTINPGFGGQALIPAMIDKAASMKKMIEQSGLHIEIQVDGGVYLNNAAALAHAGVDILVAGSAIFESSNPHEMISKLRAVI